MAMDEKHVCGLFTDALGVGGSFDCGRFVDAVAMTSSRRGGAMRDTDGKLTVGDAGELARTLRAAQAALEQAEIRDEISARDSVVEYQENVDALVAELSLGSKGAGKEFKTADKRASRIGTDVVLSSERLARLHQQCEKAQLIAQDIALFLQLNQDPEKIPAEFRDESKISQNALLYVDSASRLGVVADEMSMDKVSPTYRGREAVLRLRRTVEKSLIDQFFVERNSNDFERMKELAIAAHKFNGGRALLDEYLHKTVTREDDDRLAINMVSIANTTDLRGAGNSPLVRFLERVGELIEGECSIIQHVFPTPLETISSLISHVFERRIKPFIDKMFTSCELNAHKYVSLLHYTYTHVKRFTEVELKKKIPENMIFIYSVDSLFEQDHNKGMTLEYFEEEKKACCNALREWLVAAFPDLDAVTEEMRASGWPLPDPNKPTEVLKTYVENMKHVEERICNAKDLNPVIISLIDENFQKATDHLRMIQEAIQRASALSPPAQRPMNMKILFEAFMNAFFDGYLNPSLRIRTALAAPKAEIINPANLDPQVEFVTRVIEMVNVVIKVVDTLQMRFDKNIAPLFSLSDKEYGTCKKDLDDRITAAEKVISACMMRAVNVCRMTFRGVLEQQPKNLFNVSAESLSRTENVEKGGGIRSSPQSAQICTFLTRLRQMLMRMLDPSNTKLFLVCVVDELAKELINNMKRQSISLVGSLFLMRDITDMENVIKTFQSPEAEENFAIAREVSLLFSGELKRAVSALESSPELRKLSPDDKDALINARADKKMRFGRKEDVIKIKQGDY